MSSTDEAEALVREWFESEHPAGNLNLDALTIGIAQAIDAAHLSEREQCAKLAEDLQDDYSGGAKVMARGFGREMASRIRGRHG